MKDKNISTQEYQAISCDLYDHLEIWSMRKAVVEIVYTNETYKELRINTTIKNLVTKSKQEFLITADNKSIRLDHIIRINDLNFGDTRCSLNPES